MIFLICKTLSAVSVFLFGTIITLFFLKVQFTKKNILCFIIFISLSLFIQAIILYSFGSKTLEKIYPVIVHLPLLILCINVYHKPLISSLTSLFLAYILTIPRNLSGELMQTFFPQVPYLYDIVKFIFTFPFILLVIHFLKERIRRIINTKSRETLALLFPGLCFYFFSYIFTVYTDLLFSLNVISTELLVILFSLAFYVFIDLYLRQLDRSNQLEHEQEIFHLNMISIKKEIAEIRYSQQKTRALRHDMRHYIQIFDQLATNGDIEELHHVLQSLQQNVDELYTTHYCKNESINSILSSYIGKAKKLGIDVDAQIHIVTESFPSDLDICCLLANGIENAAQSSSKCDEKWIHIICNELDGKIVIEIQNPYIGDIRFENGLPLAESEGHGIGVQSIALIVENLNGVYSFSAENQLFTLQIIL